MRIARRNGDKSNVMGYSEMHHYDTFFLYAAHVITRSIHVGNVTKIEWTRGTDGTAGSTWTPIRARNRATGKVGWHCEHATTGCEFCYAESMNKRLGTGLPFKPGHRKDIEIFLDEEMLLAPLRWKKPRRIFVCSMTDAFADFVEDEWLDKMFAVMALCPQHMFQVLTKRAERMRQWFSDVERADHVGLAMLTIVDRIPYGHQRVPWPLPNVWLGVSCERQQEFDDRHAWLGSIPAAVRFFSFEPLLGPIDTKGSLDAGVFHWSIVGGESGRNARPMHPDWARSLRDQCAATGVPFFFKQWGTHVPVGRVDRGTATDPNEFAWERVGKKAAGRLLDGVEHNGMPVV